MRDNSRPSGRSGHVVYVVCVSHVVYDEIDRTDETDQIDLPAGQTAQSTARLKLSLRTK